MQRTFSLSIVSVSLVAIVSLFLLAVMVLPAYAQTTPKDSCIVSGRVVTIGKVIYSVGATVSSGTTKPADGATGAVSVTTPDWGTVCLINSINAVVDWIFLFLLVISVALIAIAGFLWMTSGGDAAKTKTAGQMIVAALIGIVIALLARVLPAVVLSILG